MVGEGELLSTTLLLLKKKWRLVLVTLRGSRKKGGINRRETRAYNGKAKDRYYHAPLFLSPSLASRLRS